MGSWSKVMSRMMQRPVLFLTVAYLASVKGYSGGPPQSACDSMRPGPPHQPNEVTASEAASPPYTLAAEKAAGRNGQVNVFLRTTKGGATFRGFMIMAEVHGDRGHGYFVPAPESKNLAGRLDCQGLPVTCADPAACQGTANAITHNSSDDKDSITVVWTPPSAMSGEVVFQATVVGEKQDRSTYWEEIRSNPVSL